VHAVTQVKTPNPLVGPYDTIIQRTTDISLSGVGTQQDVGLKILWLSLKSVAPITLPGTPGTFDVYVGLNDAVTQTAGKMRLTSTAADGNTGTVDIGLKGTTTDDPLNATFLGLPVSFKVLLIPAGQSATPGNVVSDIRNIPTAIFHGNTLSPSGQFQIVPEPSSWLLIGLGASFLLALRRRQFLRRRPEV